MMQSVKYLLCSTTRLCAAGHTAGSADSLYMKSGLPTNIFTAIEVNFGIFKSEICFGSLTFFWHFQCHMTVNFIVWHFGIVLTNWPFITVLNVNVDTMRSCGVCV